MVFGRPPPSSGDAVTHAELETRLSDFVRNTDLGQQLQQLKRRVRALETEQRIQGEDIMATQADIDAVTAALVSEDSALNTAVTNLTAADTAIQSEIAALQAANPALDLSGLQAEMTKSQAASAAVATAVAATAALVPAPAPAPTPVPPTTGP
jgi:TolA-binding protein